MYAICEHNMSLIAYALQMHISSDSAIFPVTHLQTYYKQAMITIKAMELKQLVEREYTSHIALHRIHILCYLDSSEANA